MKTKEEQVAKIAQIMGRCYKKTPNYIFKFGMYKGHTLAEVLKDDEGKDYLLWMYHDFSHLDPCLKMFIETELI